MSLDLRIFGAGVMGSVLARKAVERGLTVELVDPRRHEAASWAALALIRPSWHKQPERPAVKEGIEWYRGHGLLLGGDRALVTSYQAPDRPHEDAGWFLVDPVETLHQSPSEFTASEAPATWTVDCRGQAAVEDGRYHRTWGYTLRSLDAVTADGAALRIHHLRPYHSITLAELPAAAHHPREVRLGSSSNLHREKAVEEVYKMLARAEGLEMVAPGAHWNLVGGQRAVDNVHDRLGTVEFLQPTGQVRIAGLGRFGFALAPARAEEFLWFVGRPVE